MTLDEFEAWRVFDGMFPLDDHHRLYRPAAVIAASWGGDLAGVLNLLSPDPKKPTATLRPATIVKPKE